jgi:hypothetical protein
MPDNISCPHCRCLLQAPEEYEGRELRCPKCQEIFVAAARTEITAQAPRPASPPATSEVQPGPAPATLNRRVRLRRAPADPDDDLPPQAHSQRAFRPAGGLGLAVKILLAVNLLLSVTVLGSEYMQYNLAIRLIAREDVAQVELVSNDARQAALGIIHLPLYIATVVVFVVWFYRAHANLETLGARDLTYTSGWAAGCWFVPFLNLVRPLQIAQEIWRHSDPSGMAGNSTCPGTSGNSALVGFWWAMWITTNVISNISIRMAWSVNTPETLKSASVLGMFAEITAVIATVLALAVVSGIDARQAARAQARLTVTGSSWDEDE